MRPNCFVEHPRHQPGVPAVGRQGRVRDPGDARRAAGATYGVYAGFEIYEHKVLAPGKEEYLDSEKFQYRPRDWAAASHTSLMPYITTLNRIRREHPAFHELRNLRFETIDNSQLIGFSKRHAEEVVVVTCVLDPNSPQAGVLHLDLAPSGSAPTSRCWPTT